MTAGDGFLSTAHPIAGQYTAAYTPPSGSSTPMGQAEAGFTIDHSIACRQVTGDAAAETSQDGIFRGVQMFLQYTLIEFNQPAAELLMWPMNTGTSYGGGWLTAPTGGQLVSSYAGSLVLTALAGTPAAAVGSRKGPSTVTLPLVFLAEGFPVAVLLAPDLRTVPIRQRIYPTYTTGVIGGGSAPGLVFGSLT